MVQEVNGVLPLLRNSTWGLSQMGFVREESFDPFGAMTSTISASSAWSAGP